MKTRLFLLSFLFYGLYVQAQNIEVSGIQSGTWDADTVFVNGDVMIDDALTINAGTTVFFNGYYKIDVKQDAMLNAIGTETDSITFTVGDTTSFHLFNSGRGGWNGIRLENADASRFDYCRFQYGKATFDDDQDGGALRIYGCNDVEIGHSTLFCNFSREHGGALNAQDSKIVMHNCNVYNNLTYTKLDTVYFMYGGGLRFLKCEVELTDTDFRYNNGQSAIGGAMSLDSCTVRIDRCRFEHNRGINGAGLYLIRCYDNPCSITNSLFANNVSEHFGGGLAISDSSPLVSNLTVVNNHSIGVNCGGIFFYQYSSPTVWNCIVYGNTNQDLIEEPVQMWTWIFDGYAPEFHNCLVQFGFENISNHEIITVYENCLEEDPLFADALNEDFHLTASSPCVNAGSPDTPEEVLNGTDLNGNWRVCGDRIDMGAYEFTTTGFHETVQNKQLVHIVGNPITEASYAKIEVENASSYTAKVYSIDGKLLIDKNLGPFSSGTHHIALGEMFQSLAKGPYLLVIQGGEQTFSAKLIR